MELSFCSQCSEISQCCKLWVSYDSFYWGLIKLLCLETHSWENFLNNFISHCLFLDFTYFLEREEGREKERERNIDHCLSRVPNWGPGPQPRHVLLPGIEPARTTPNSLGYTRQGSLVIFLTFCFLLSFWQLYFLDVRPLKLVLIFSPSSIFILLDFVLPGRFFLTLFSNSINYFLKLLLSCFLFSRSLKNSYPLS